jgi:hypothetical protein
VTTSVYVEDEEFGNHIGQIYHGITSENSRIVIGKTYGNYGLYTYRLLGYVKFATELSLYYDGLSTLAKSSSSSSSFSSSSSHIVNQTEIATYIYIYI